MKNKFVVKHLIFALSLFGMIAIFSSCNEEDDVKLYPIADFDTEQDSENPYSIKFINKSHNGTSYSWDFGDSQTSTDESPTHVYGTFGEYTITFTVIADDGDEDKVQKTIVIDDPDTELKKITGEVSKKWILMREGVALGIYSPEGGAWWEFAGSGLADRPCILDDEITFHFDGNVTVDTKNTFWLDSEANGGWNDALGEGCHDESEADVWKAADGTDVSAFANGGDYTFDYDYSDKVMVVSGLGFYVGLTSKTNDGDNALPISTKTYEVTSFEEGDGFDKMQLTMWLGDGASWKFNLIHYDDFSQAPEIPTKEPSTKPVEANDLYDVFTGEANSANITWKTDEVTGFTLGVANPDAGETFLCAKYEKGTGTTENVQVTLDYIMDLSTRNQFSVKAYVPSANDYTSVDPAPEGWAPHTTLQKQIVLRFYDSTHGAPWETQAQKVFVVDDANLDKWVDITFDFSDIADNQTYDKVIFQLGSEGHHMPGTFYLADFKLNQ